jgi:hypothetical protein
MHEKWPRIARINTDKLRLVILSEAKDLCSCSLFSVASAVKAPDRIVESKL